MTCQDECVDCHVSQMAFPRELIFRRATPERRTVRINTLAPVPQEAILAPRDAIYSHVSKAGGIAECKVLNIRTGAYRDGGPNMQNLMCLLCLHAKNGTQVKYVPHPTTAIASRYSRLQRILSRLRMSHTTRPSTFPNDYRRYTARVRPTLSG